MVRLCLRGFAASIVAYFCFGCSGQNIEGTWLGPLPFEDAKACRIKIYSDHRFDVSCMGDEWVGAGRYERDADRLRLVFGALVRRGQVLQRPPTLALAFAGKGNLLELHVIPDDGRPFEWSRARL